ncbi:MAG TPA: PilZ domain-containing protein [Polyangiales bacterium]|nr:PilZ domain-containing protein [Polyangiales bacterium]
MISTPERRQGEHARIPCAIPVELTPDTRGPGFEADAVDLSAGGLSLRASNLPEVGSMLNCRFETLPGGTRITGRGEVVWAKLSGERSGEFGLRFTEIEPEAQALLAEMIAERVANSAAAPAIEPPRTATLELDRAEGPITAKLTRAVGQDIVFEQPLDLLALGSSVVAHADKSLGQGNILRVDLRMDGGTPTLALTVRFSQPQEEEYGEYDWGEPESGTRPRSAEPELASPVGGHDREVDTVPDLAAPLGVIEEEPSQPVLQPVAAAPVVAVETTPAVEAAAADAELDAAADARRTAVGYPKPIGGSHSRTVAGYAFPQPQAAGGEEEEEEEDEEDELDEDEAEEDEREEEDDEDSDEEEDDEDEIEDALTERRTPHGIAAEQASPEEDAETAGHGGEEIAPASPHALAASLVAADRNTRLARELAAAQALQPRALARNTARAISAERYAAQVIAAQRPQQLAAAAALPAAGAAASPWADAPDTEPDALAHVPEAKRESVRPAPQQLGLHLAHIPRAPIVPRAVPRTPLLRNREDYRAREYLQHEAEPQIDEYDAVSVDEPAEDSVPDGYELASTPGEEWAAENEDENWSESQPDETPSWAQRDALYDSQASLNENAPNTPLVRFFRVFASGLESAQPALSALRRTWLRTYLAVVPNLRKRLVGVPLVKTTLRGVGARPRRSVGLPTVERLPTWTRGMSRLAMLAALMIGCGVLLVYAMAPAAPSEDVVAQPVVQPPAAETTESAAVDPAAAEPIEHEEPTAAPARNQLSRSKPLQPTAAETAALSFGAKSVPNPQRYLIRMSDPVKALHGKSDPRGFIVQVPGSRAIDRAAPIAAGNRAVAKSSILNKGTHAELNIRFAEGRSPAYRVTAQQAGLEVLISQ